MQHRNNDRIKNLLKPQANIIRWIWDWMKLLQLELRNVITGGSKSRSAFYEVYYKACLHIMGQKEKKTMKNFVHGKNWWQVLLRYNLVKTATRKPITTTNKKISPGKKKSPEALALLLVRECKRADILLKTSPRRRTLCYETFRFPKGNDSSQGAGCHVLETINGLRLHGKGGLERRHCARRQEIYCITGVIGEPSAYICQAIRNDKKYPISIGVTLAKCKLIARIT